MRLITSLVLILSLATAHAQFTDVTEELGVTIEVDNPGFMGGGCAWFDHNGDGWEDIYLCGGESMDRLYENNGDGTFTDISEGSGLEFTALAHTFGVVTGDLDNDGDADLVITTSYDPSDFTHPPILILENMGGGLFLDMADVANVDQNSSSSSAALIDINNDGWLDIYVGNYIFMVGFLDEEGIIYGFDHDCYSDFLYINNQDGTFTESSETYGAVNTGCTLAVAATDYDRDGDSDLMIANDFGEWILPDVLFENEYPVEMVSDVGMATGADVGLYGMGVATGDYDEDLDLDYYITNLGDNALLRQEGGIFDEVAEELGVINGFTDSLRHTGWGTFFFDHNNDSYLDLFVTNGRIPAFDFIANEFYDSNKLYQNGPDYTFIDVTESMGLADSLVGRGCAYADYDHDGDLDILVGNTTNQTDIPAVQTNKLYRNDSNNDNHWVVLELQGVTANLDGIGAQVEVHAGGRSFLREITSGGPHASDNSKIIHFGLGEINFIDSAQVIWPGGETQTVFLNVDEYTQVTQGEISTEIENSKSQLTLFPNPSQGNLTLRSQQLTAGSLIRISNLEGQIVHQTQSTGSLEARIILPAHLAEGVYILDVQTADNVLSSFFAVRY